MVLSCASGEKKDGAEVKELAVSAKEVVITNSVIEITHDSKTLNSFYSIGDIFEDHYYAYNQNTHAIDIYSLDTRQHIKTVELEDEGPDGVQKQIFGLNVLNADDFAILTDHYITRVGTNSKVIQRLPINGVGPNEYFIEYNLHARNNSNFIYDSNTESFLIPQVSMVDQRVTKEFFKHPILAEYKPNEDLVNPYEVYYPDDFYEKCFGFNDQKSFSYTRQDTVLYALSGYPGIFVYDRNSKKTAEVKINTDDLQHNEVFHQPWSTAANLGQQMKTMMKSSQFGPIAETEDYVILFYHSALKGDQNDLRNPFARKDKMMQVYEKETFKYITTQQLPEEVILVKDFHIDKNSVIIPVAPKTEDIIRMQKIEINAG